jgi:hypothetical protein
MRVSADTNAISKRTAKAQLVSSDRKIAGCAGNVSIFVIPSRKKSAQNTKLRHTSVTVAGKSQGAL